MSDYEILMVKEVQDAQRKVRMKGRGNLGIELARYSVRFRHSIKRMAPLYKLLADVLYFVTYNHAVLFKIIGSFYCNNCNLAAECYCCSLVPNAIKRDRRAN